MANIYGTAGNDVLLGINAEENFIDGGPQIDPASDIGNDLVVGGSLADTIFGRGGSDNLVGSDGNDYLNGGDGNDQVSGNNGNDTIDGDSGDDTLNGGAGDDVLNGQLGTDTLDGGDGNDALLIFAGVALGGTGDDTLSCFGIGSLDGGEGSDTYSLSTSGVVTVRDTGGGFDQINASANIVLAADAAIEVVTLVFNGQTVTALGDTAIQLVGNALRNTLISGGGIDTLEGGDDNDTLSAGGNDDVVLGGEGRDSLDGGDGNDFLAGGLGADTLLGGAGNDAIDDNIIFAVGDDRRSADLLVGGNGADTLTSGAGADTLDGGNGNDAAAIYRTNATADLTFILAPAGGTAFVQGDAAIVTVTGIETLFFISGSGDDRLTAGAGADGLSGGGGDDTLSGKAGRDRLDGDAGADLMAGGSGRDEMRGGDGNDTVIGGGNADLLSGGSGADAFRWLDLDGARDVVTDFVAGEDRLEFAADALGGLLPVGALAASRLSFDAASGTDAQFVYRAATGVLSWDADGTGAGVAVTVVDFATLPALTASDIVVIA